MTNKPPGTQIILKRLVASGCIICSWQSKFGRHSCCAYLPKWRNISKHYYWFQHQLPFSDFRSFAIWTLFHCAFLNIVLVMAGFFNLFLPQILSMYYFCYRLFCYIPNCSCDLFPFFWTRAKCFLFYYKWRPHYSRVALKVMYLSCLTMTWTFPLFVIIHIFLL